jgi:hypothetical protein
MSCEKPEIVIVSGLPRSGTSMMMRMLEAGGLPVLVDQQREADADNPNGYYEYEPVLRLKRDNSWVGEAVGKVVKIVYMLLYHLPADYHYKVVFMDRDLEEVIASQEVMLRRKGVAPPEGESQPDMKVLFRKQLADFFRWIEQQPNFEVERVNYAEVLQDPPAIAERLSRFLERELDLQAMARVCDPSLHRQRRA